MDQICTLSAHVESTDNAIASNVFPAALCVPEDATVAVIATVLKVAASVAAAVILVGCTSGRGETSNEVLVSAAASLTSAFTEIESAFEEQNPGIDVLLNLAGSATLSSQIVEGAPADVFASASITNMIPVIEAEMASAQPDVFARNDMQIAVPPSNPGRITGLADFSNDDLLIGLCAERVPCGDLAREVLARAGISARIDTNEPNVRSLLTKIELGELDAGIVYSTDVAASDTVEGITIPRDTNVETSYVIAALSGARNPDGAGAFVAFVTSADGQAILDRYGFSSP
jgi:molybdate transport system substrate-binding protein